MDTTAIMQAISTVGFPIVACAAMFWQLQKSDERHRQEMEKITEAINNNTAAVLKLSERMHAADKGG